jgi:SAM-dependent methyltransferase
MKCHFVFLDPVPGRTPVEIYDEDYFRGKIAVENTFNVEGWDFFEPENFRNFLTQCRARLDRVETFTKGGTLLDIGCGIGLFLHEAKSRGWHVHGIDASPFAVSYARQELGLETVQQMDVDNLVYDSGTMDAITLHHVIEHVINPRRLLQSASRIIKKGGILVIETPDISSKRAKRAGLNWKYLRIPEHLNYFSAATLNRLLEQTGFGVLQREYAVESTGMMNALLGGEEKARSLYDQWSRCGAFRWAVRSTRRINEYISGKLVGEFDILTVTARKR